MRKECACDLLLQYEIDRHRPLIFWGKGGHDMSRESARIP
jgi:hypothetical protein